MGRNRPHKPEEGGIVINFIGHQLTPEKLIKEIEARAYGEGTLVVLTLTQWKAITEAYQSPLVRNIADTTLLISLLRDAVSEELSFVASAREFKR